MAEGNRTPRYDGHVYQAPSGQFSWKITEDGNEICGGAGYATEAQAVADCEDILWNYDENAECRVGGPRVAPSR